MLQDIHYKSNRWRCLKCGESCCFDDLEWRYRIRMTIADTNEYRQVAVFGRTLQPFFGTSANTFHKFLSYLQSTKCEVADATLKQAVYQVFVGQPFLFGFASANQPKSDISVSSLSHVAGGKGSNSDLIAVQMLSTSLSQMGTVSQQMSQLLNRRTEDSFCPPPSEMTKYINGSPVSVVRKRRSHETRQSLLNSVLDVSDNSNINSLLSVLLSCENSLSNNVSVSSALLNSVDMTEDRAMLKEGNTIGHVKISCGDDVITDPTTSITLVQPGKDYDADNTMDLQPRVSQITSQDDINSDSAMDNTFGKYYKDPDETVDEQPGVSAKISCKEDIDSAMDNTLGEYYTDPGETVNEQYRVSAKILHKDDIDSDSALDSTLGKYYIGPDETMNDSSLLLALNEPSSCNSPKQVPVDVKSVTTETKQSRVGSVGGTVFNYRQDGSAVGEDCQAPADEWEEMPYSEDLDEFLQKAGTEEHGHGVLQNPVGHHNSLLGHSDHTLNAKVSFRHHEMLEPAVYGVRTFDEIVCDSEEIPCFEDPRSQVKHMLERERDGCDQNCGSVMQRDTVKVTHQCGIDRINERSKHVISTIDKDMSVYKDGFLGSKGMVQKTHLAAGEYMQSCNDVSVPVNERMVTDGTMDRVCWEDMPESEDLEQFLLEAGRSYVPVSDQHTTTNTIPDNLHRSHTIADAYCRSNTIAESHCRSQTRADGHCQLQTIGVSSRYADPTEPSVTLETFPEDSFSDNDSVFCRSIVLPVNERTVNNGDVSSKGITSFRTSHHSSDRYVLGPSTSGTLQHQGHNSKHTGGISMPLSCNLRSQHSNSKSMNEQSSIVTMVKEKTSRLGTCSNLSKDHHPENDSSLNGSTELFDSSGADLFECLSNEEEKCLMEEDPEADLLDKSAVCDSVVEMQDGLGQNTSSEGMVSAVKDVSAVWESMMEMKQGALLQDNSCLASPGFQKQVKFAKRLSHISSIQLIDIRMKLNFGLPMDSQLTPVRSCLRSVQTPEVTKYESKGLEEKNFSEKEKRSPLKIISSMKSCQKHQTLSHGVTLASAQNDANTDLGPVHRESDNDNMDDYGFQQSQDLFANSQPTDHVSWGSCFSESDTSPAAGGGCEPSDEGGCFDFHPPRTRML
ncbi:uncharacterized protein LOC124277439 [Haliotis rubra]|uniref:uncharacterized protein LOC124277439 n=1 Tax=Haliotis rubra TaxID=36100 RepID=UPI001EE575B0|nr:uncharacterized protein LOC124277439 [Haliotis rubra]